MATIGQKIKTFRTLKKITQLELAEKIGGDRSTISRVEADQLKPNAAILAALANYGMNIDELLTEGNDVTKEKALQMRVAELELKLMNVESKLTTLIKLVEDKL